jgi:hypothetical protein
MTVSSPITSWERDFSDFVVPCEQGCHRAFMAHTLFSVSAFIVPISRLAFQGAGFVLAPSSPQRAAPQQGLS